MEKLRTGIPRNQQRGVGMCNESALILAGRNYILAGHKSADISIYPKALILMQYSSTSKAWARC